MINPFLTDSSYQVARTFSSSASFLSATGLTPQPSMMYFDSTMLSYSVYNGSTWAPLITGGISALTSDVSATGPGSVAATVNSVGGSSAANIHTAELAANAATSNNTVSTIVARDPNGRFIASGLMLGTSPSAIALTTANEFIVGPYSNVVTGSGPTIYILEASAGGALTGPALGLLGFRGTTALPTATQMGDWIGKIKFGGWGSTNPWISTGSIFGVATENHTDTARGHQINFSIINNTTTIVKNALTIDHDGTLIVKQGAGLSGVVSASLLTLVQQATPSTPVAGSDKLYFKSDDNLYRLTSGGIETQISLAGSDLPLAGGTMVGAINMDAHSSGTSPLNIGTYPLNFSGLNNGSTVANGLYMANVISGDTNILKIISEGAPNNIYIYGYDSQLTGHAPTIKLNAAVGTSTSPSCYTTVSQLIGGLQIQLWNGSGFHQNVGIKAITLEVQSAGHMGTGWLFDVTPIGADNSLQHVFEMAYEGNQSLVPLAVATSVTVPLVQGGSGANGTLLLSSTSNVAQGYIQIVDGSSLELGPNSALQAQRLIDRYAVTYPQLGSYLLINASGDSSGGRSGIILEEASEWSQGCTISIARAHGTYTAPTQLLYGDIIGGIQWLSPTVPDIGGNILAVAGTTCAWVFAFCDEPDGQTNDAAGTGLQFNTSPRGQASDVTPRMIIDGLGNVSVGQNGGNLISYGSVMIPDGLISAPAIAFSSEPTTGIYRSTANHIDFAIGGVQALSLASDNPYGGFVISMPHDVSGFLIGPGTSIADLSQIDLASNAGCQMSMLGYGAGSYINLSKVDGTYAVPSATPIGDYSSINFRGWNGVGSFSPSSSLSLGAYIVASAQNSWSAGHQETNLDLGIWTSNGNKYGLTVGSGGISNATVTIGRGGYVTLNLYNSNVGLLSTDSAGNVGSTTVSSPLVYTPSGAPGVYGTLSVVASVGAWTKYTVTFDELFAAALTNTITLFTAPAKTAITGVIVKHSTAFSGGTISAYTVSIGIPTQTQRYSAAFNVFQAVGDPVSQSTTNLDVPSFANPTTVQITATSVGDTLDHALQGSVDVWIQTAIIP